MCVPAALASARVTGDRLLLLPDRRVYVSSPESVSHITTRTKQLGPNGEEWVWWQCTVKVSTVLES